MVNRRLPIIINAFYVSQIEDGRNFADRTERRLINQGKFGANRGIQRASYFEAELLRIVMYKDAHGEYPSDACG